jgi:diacylglycerol kinase (ATP)|tara:strand:+ start:5620 stop:5955 length:336 start_codon:yes stop_codon:yes gene_type:complete
MNKFYNNLINSINGLKFVLKEHSFIAELVGGVILIPYLFFIEFSILFKIAIISIYILLLAFEIMNTAIEKLCDKITKEIDSDIKIIKDLASASVFILLILLVIMILFTFFM